MSGYFRPIETGGHANLGPLEAPSGGGSTVTGVSITPSFATMVGGAVLDFNALVDGSGGPSQAVTWSIDLGGVDSNGTVTAPASTGSTQMAHLTATSDQDPSHSATVAITIPPTDAVAPTATVTFRPFRTNPMRVVRLA